MQRSQIIKIEVAIITVFYVFLVNSLVASLAIFIHYEFMWRMTAFMPRLNVHHRYRIVFGVFGALIAHAAEVWLFALTYYGMEKIEGWGHFEGNFDGTLMDCAYFSFTTFTTLGFGDIEPIGNVRYLTGIEALVGLVLITWTASFLYLEMRRYWDSE